MPKAICHEVGNNQCPQIEHLLEMAMYPQPDELSNPSEQHRSTHVVRERVHLQCWREFCPQSLAMISQLCKLDERLD